MTIKLSNVFKDLKTIFTNITVLTKHAGVAKKHTFVGISVIMPFLNHFRGTVIVDDTCSTMFTTDTIYFFIL